MENELPKRKPNRIPNYDYSKNGAYFVTICTDKMRSMFGEVRRGEACPRPQTDECTIIALTPLGKICEEHIEIISERFNIEIVNHIIMPNHIHILYSIERERATARVAPTMAKIVGTYKSLVANAWLKEFKKKGITMGKVFQRGFYDHVVRDEKNLVRIWEYIEYNPHNWDIKQFYNE